MTNFAPFLDAQFPTVQALQDLINTRGPVDNGVARISFRAQLLDGNRNPFQLQAPPNPADPSDVSQYVNVKSVAWNGSNDVMLTASFTLQVFPGIGQVNTLRDTIKLWGQYRGEDDAVLKEFPMGVFCFMIPDNQIQDSGNMWSVDGSDLGFRLQRTLIDNIVVIPQGFNLIEAAYWALMADRLPPSEGGRQPSGISTWTGDPTDPCGGQNRPPDPGTGIRGGYSDQCQSGSPVETMGLAGGWTEDAGGYFHSPSGAVHNPLSGAMVTADGIPIDPWACEPMAAVSETPNTFMAEAGTLWFNTYTGGFYTPGYPDGQQVQGMIDPFTGDTYPPGVVPYTPLGGSTLPPLLSWPYDWDATGPNFGQTRALADLGYCGTGVPLSRAGMYSLDETTGYYRWTAGSPPAWGDLLFNPYAGILVDPNSGIPIDPWSCTPMDPQQLPVRVTTGGSAPWWYFLADSGTLAYDVQGGGFLRVQDVRDVVPGAAPQTQPWWDIFHNQAARLNLPYRDPAQQTLFTEAEAGTLPAGMQIPMPPWTVPPLASWPHDARGTGPLMTVGGRLPCTPPTPPPTPLPTTLAADPFDYSHVLTSPSAVLISGTPGATATGDTWTYTTPPGMTDGDGNPLSFEVSYNARCLVVPHPLYPLAVSAHTGETAEAFTETSGHFAMPSGEQMDPLTGLIYDDILQELIWSGWPLPSATPVTVSPTEPTTTAAAGVTSISFGQGVNLGSRRAPTGLSAPAEVLILPAGTYNLGVTTCEPDPTNGYQWCHVVPGDATATYDAVSADGEVTYDAGDWRLTILLSNRTLGSSDGHPLWSGGLYLRSRAGDTLLSDLGTADAENTTAAYPDVETWVLALALEDAVTVPAGGSLVLKLGLTTGDLYGNVTPASPSAAWAITGMTLDTPENTVTVPVNALPSAGTTLSSGTADTPVQSGTAIPWPDSNAPGLGPNGCDFFGANYPREQIHIPPANVVATGPIRFNRKQSLLDLVNTILVMANYQKLTFDRNGEPLSSPIPWQFTDDTGNAYIPTVPDWTSTTDDGSVIVSPIVTKINDQTTVGNYVKFESEPNTGTPIYLRLLNRSPDSMVSVDELGYILGIRIQDDTVTDVAWAQLEAHLALLQAALPLLAGQWTTALNPLAEPWWLYNLNAYKVIDETGEIDWDIDSTHTFYPFQVSAYTHDCEKYTTAYVAGKLVPV